MGNGVLSVRAALHMSIAALFLGICAAPAYARQDSTISRDSDAGSDVRTVLHDAGTIFSAPVRFDRDQWIETGAVVAVTALAFTVDDDIRSLALRNESRIGGDFADVGRAYGGVLNAIAISGCIYVGGLALGSDDVRMAGLEASESIVFAGVTTVVLKSVFGRSRPFLEEGPTRFYGFRSNFEYTSLPSGHTTVAFALSSSLAGRISNTWAKAGLYSLAAITACSRVYDDEHWFSDTILGAAIGTSVGMSISHAHRDESTQSSLRVEPSLKGIRLVYTF